jgi:DnaJ-class molecular chaperone
MFGGGAGGARAGGGAHFEQEDFGPAGAQDLQATLTITLPEAAMGSKARVSLPTGKEIDVKIPAGFPAGIDRCKAR